MKPKSGLSIDRDSFFFSSRAMAAESVRGRRIVSLELSATTSESLQLRAATPVSVAQPERKSLDGPPAAFCIHSVEAAFLPTQAASSTVGGRWETEYIRAASEETATARSRKAISSSPMTNPRRAAVRCAESACKLTLVFHPVVDPGVLQSYKGTRWRRGPRDFARVVRICLCTIRGRGGLVGSQLDV
jgi:hypothetical protein